MINRTSVWGFTMMAIIVGCLSSPSLAQQPNILWIIADDLSPDLGAYGYDAVSTPNLDRLAGEGVRYTNAFANSPVCSAQRSSLITGMYPTTIGVQSHRMTSSTKQNLPTGIEPITEYFRDEGYYVTNANSGVTGSGKTDYNFLSGVSGGMYDGFNWANRAPGQPFFAQVQIFEPHRNFQTNTDPSRLADVEFPSYYPDHPVTRADWANYLVSIEELDRKVGLILDRLDSEGLADDTVVMFFGDHGRPQARDKQWLYDGGLRVPLIIRGPGSEFTAGTVNDEMVSLVDIGVGSLGLTGATLPTHLQGEDIFDPSFTGRDAVFASRDRMGSIQDRVRSVQVGDLKLIRNFDPSLSYMKGDQESHSYKRLQYPVHTLLLELEEQGELTPDQMKFLATSRPEYELYDLSTDPEELNNLASDPAYAAQLADLQGRLATYITETDDAGFYPLNPTVENTLIQNSLNFATNQLANRGFTLNGDRTLELQYWEQQLGITHQTLSSGQTLDMGATQADDLPANGGTITVAPFTGNGAGASPATGGVMVGNVDAGSGAAVQGLGLIAGNVTIESGAVLRVGGTGIGTTSSGTTTTEDFESVSAGSAFANGTSTGLLAGWTFDDLAPANGSSTDVVFNVIDTATETAWTPTVARSQMLAQMALNPDFTREGGNGEVIGGALAVAGPGSGIDSSGTVDIIEADFVLGDALGDPSGRFLDTKIVFGYQDADNFFALTLLQGESSGATTEARIRAVVGGVVTDVFAAAGTSWFTDKFPDTDAATNAILHAKLIHDASSGFVSFEISDGDNPSTVYANATASHAILASDGLVGFGVSNDAGAWDNLSVTTQAALPASGVQVLGVAGVLTLDPGAMVEIDLASASAYDRLDVSGVAHLAGGLDVTVDGGFTPGLGDSFLVAVSDALNGTFDNSQVNVSALPDVDGNQVGLAVLYENSDSDTDLDQVRVMATYKGDTNGDGSVGPADLTALKLSWLATGATWQDGDSNYDGSVGPADLTDMKLNWLEAIPAPGGGIPEPTSVALLGLGSMALLRRRR